MSNVHVVWYGLEGGLSPVGGFLARDALDGGQKVEDIGALLVLEVDAADELVGLRASGRRSGRAFVI